MLNRMLLGGGGDPYFGNVGLLLTMNGANTGTVFTDTGPHVLTVTPTATTTSSTKTRFGGNTGKFLLASSSRLALAQSSFVTVPVATPWTIEFSFQYVTAVAANLSIFTIGANLDLLSIVIDNTSKLYMYYGNGAGYISAALTINTWYDVSVSYGGSGNFTGVDCYINGSLQTTPVGSAITTFTNGVITFGDTNGILLNDSSPDMYLSNFRFTGGVRRPKRGTAPSQYFSRNAER